MKRAFILTLFTAAAAWLSAQQEPVSRQYFSPDFFKKQPKVHARSGDFYVVDSIYCYRYDTASQSDVAQNRTYNLAFSPAGEALQSVEQDYLPASNDWLNTRRNTYTFDTEGNLLQQIAEHWDTAGQVWQNFTRTQNTPNTNGDYTLVLNQQWSTSFGGWRNADRLIFTWDGEVIQALEQELWDTLTGVWKKNFNIIYAANGSGQVFVSLFSLWNAALNGYQLISKNTYTYDPDYPDREVENLAEVWNAATATWHNSSRNLKSYSPNGNLVEQIGQLWYPPDTTWVNNNRILQNFNADGQVTLRTEQLWNLDVWLNYFQTNSVFDANNNLSHFEVSQWLTTDWQKLTECDFFWRFHHEVPTTQQQPVNFDCIVPNPLSSGGAISCPDLPAGKSYRLVLFDLTGKMRYTKSLADPNFTDLAASLPTGLYVLTIAEGRQIIFRKKVLVIRNS